MTVYPSGIAYPFRFSETGGVSTAEGAEKIQSNLKNLVLTAMRERLGRKNVGTVGYQRVFRSMGRADANLLIGLVRQAIAAQEPRVLISSITVTTDPYEKLQTVNIDGEMKNSGEPFALSVQL